MLIYSDAATTYEGDSALGYMVVMGLVVGDDEYYTLFSLFKYRCFTRYNCL